jgi:hypothetical protein
MMGIKCIGKHNETFLDEKLYVSNKKLGKIQIEV